MNILFYFLCLLNLGFQYVKGNTAMPWIYSKNAGCSGLTGRMDYIIQHKKYFSIVSPTVYYVSNNGTDLLTWSSGCINTTLEEFSQQFTQNGIEVYPHIAYDSVNISSLRHGILGNLTKQNDFLETVIDRAKYYNYTGISFDLFPDNDELGYINFVDGQLYANLVDNLAKRLHNINKLLRVYAEPGDFFSNIDLLTKTDTDLIITQAYEYSIDVATFRTKLEFALNHVNKTKLGIGLCPSCLSSKKFTNKAIQWRFEQLSLYNITDIGIWTSSVPDYWLPYLYKFLENNY